MKDFFNRFLLAISIFILLPILIFCSIYLIIAFITWEIYPPDIDWFMVRTYVIIAMCLSIILTIND